LQILLSRSLCGFEHQQGGHLNPAITLGLLVAKKVTLMRALFYWGAQIAGAILGSAFVYAVRPSTSAV